MGLSASGRLCWIRSSIRLRWSWHEVPRIRRGELHADPLGAPEGGAADARADAAGAGEGARRVDERGAVLGGGTISAECLPLCADQEAAEAGVRGEEVSNDASILAPAILPLCERCRICGCGGDECSLAWGEKGCWTNELRTLCSNPRCVTAAARQP